MNLLPMTQSAYFGRRRQERLWRRQFFYTAFRALAFNGISGDYVEFGSHGGTTFELAFR